MEIGGFYGAKSQWRVLRSLGRGGQGEVYRRTARRRHVRAVLAPLNGKRIDVVSRTRIGEIT